jgi:hypothetical protein
VSVIVATMAPMTVEYTRNWLTGAFVKPEEIIVLVFTLSRGL